MGWWIQIENGILHSRTYDCGINISDLNSYRHNFILGGCDTESDDCCDDLIMCRSLANSPFELDINPVLNQLPNHDLYRLELANHVILKLIV
ncbi:hypothetical protein O9929_14250 [Vibrio lentus]|nr:hypothetical protein [Vibrio lentus]